MGAQSSSLWTSIRAGPAHAEAVADEPLTSLVLGQKRPQVAQLRLLYIQHTSRSLVGPHHLATPGLKMAVEAGVKIVASESPARSIQLSRASGQEQPYALKRRRADRMLSTRE